MGIQEAPQDLHGQDTERGPPERNRQMEANVCDDDDDDAFYLWRLSKHPRSPHKQIK